MKDRIAHIIRAKNLKASDFAAMLGIQPSAVSHILAGRNKPSLEFVKKIKETFPEYNLDWIIFGTGPMTTSEPFLDASKTQGSRASEPSLDVAHPTGSRAGDPFFDTPSSPSSRAGEPMDALFGTPPSFDRTPPQVSPLDPDDPLDFMETDLPLSPNIKSIVVFYSDGTFESFQPR